MAHKPRSPKAEIKLGFDTEMITLRLEQIIPLRALTPNMGDSTKFKQIAASIKEVGVIEPPVVVQDTQTKSRYILLDGHLRIQALREIGEKEVACLISRDDESYTYNRHVNRLSTIQEHRMIVRAVERGVPEEKIARALSVDVHSIVRKRNLLKGICPEAAEMLKDKIVSSHVFPILRKMKPVRQVEIAGLMNDSGIYTHPYAQALLAATPRSQLVEPEVPKKIKGLDERQMARMEGEMASLQREYRLIEEHYGTDVLNLTIAKAYLATLLGNARIVRYLAQQHPEILTQFQKIAEMASLTMKSAPG